jgi:hypothetical protein
MIVAIIIAFVITVVLIALGNLIQSKLCPKPIPAEWVWVVWVVVVVLIVAAWWNLVIGPHIGPLP